MKERIIPFLNYKHYAYALSIGMFVIFMLVTLVFKDGMKLGVDFLGGQKIIARLENGVDEARIRKALTAYNPQVQQIGEAAKNEFIISTKLGKESSQMTKETIIKLLKSNYPLMTIINEEVLLISMKDTVDEKNIIAKLAGFDAVLQNINAPGKNEYVIYKKESPDKKKTNYNVDTIRNLLNREYENVDILSGISAFTLFDKPVEDLALKKLLTNLNVLTIKTGYVQKQGYIIYNVAFDASDKIKSELEKNFKKVEIMSVDNVGPAVGEYLRKSAFQLIAVAILLMTIYLAYRFEFRYAVGAMIAVLHDVTLSVAFCGVAGIEINIPVVAALLTIFGYSVNDTIVIFDRIRESTQIQSKLSFVEVVNKSITFTMSRTILTSFLTLLSVFALFILGGEGISDFALVLLFGMLVGVYSTVYIASPVVISWEKLMARVRSR